MIPSGSPAIHSATHAWHPSTPDEFSPRATTVNNWKRSDGSSARHVPNPLPVGTPPQVAALAGAHGWPLAAWSPAPPRKVEEDVGDDAAAQGTADRARIRKVSIYHFKKRADVSSPENGENPTTTIARSASASNSNSQPRQLHITRSGNVSAQSRPGNAKETDRPRSALLVSSQRDKIADQKAVKTRAGQDSWRHPALLLACSRVEAATESLAGEIEGSLMRDEHRKLEKLGLLGAGGTMREHLEAHLRDQDRVEALHRKLQKIQADIDAQDAEIAAKEAAIREQRRKATGLEQTVKHLKEELKKPSEAERLAMSEKEDALERLRRREKAAIAKNARILEQSQQMKRLENEVRQLKQQLQVRPVVELKKVLKKVHRPRDLRLKPRKKLDDLTVARTMGLLNILPEYSPRAAMSAAARTREELEFEANFGIAARQSAAIPLEVSDV